MDLLPIPWRFILPGDKGRHLMWVSYTPS